MKVLAALSGGVDSAVAAARAVDAGHDVTAVHFALSANPAATREGARGCCTLSDARDARRAADALGIPFYVWDLAERFREEVIEDFLAEYAAGRTPNPCVRCNERIKFAAVLERAMDLGFDAVCTGHYARVGVDDAGRPWLRRGVDPGKDQSYVLAVLTPNQLRHTLLPLGDSTKAAVRDEAEERGLKVARKPDSHDICFIPDGDTRTWLGARLGVRTGEILDAVTGEELGRHDGTHGFTIGQRRGLGLTRPAADGQPRYVVAIDPAANTVTVGPAAMLDAAEIVTGEPLWVSVEGADEFGAAEALSGVGARGAAEARGLAALSGTVAVEEALNPEEVLSGTAALRGDSVTGDSAAPAATVGRRLMVQIRAHGEPVPARVGITADGMVVRLEESLRAVAPGQTLVVYDRDTVVASATITAGYASLTATAGV